MKGNYYINLALLEKNHACSIQRIRFESTFGQSDVLFNRANFNKAWRARLSYTWLVFELLDKIREKFGSETFERLDSEFFKIAYGDTKPMFAASRKVPVYEFIVKLMTKLEQRKPVTR